MLVAPGGLHLFCKVLALLKLCSYSDTRQQRRHVPGFSWRRNSQSEPPAPKCCCAGAFACVQAPITFPDHPRELCDDGNLV